MPLVHAILGFLDHGPKTGYELKKSFDQSVAHFWTATQSHVYKALEGLEVDGHVESEVIPQEGKPSRKLYRITPSGREELDHWCATPLPAEVSRQAWLVQVFFAHGVTNEELIGLFEARIDALRDHASHVEGAGTSVDEQGRRIGVARMQELWRLTLDYGLDHYRSEIAWLEGALPRLRALPALSTDRKVAATPTGA